jgi:putative copper resistance protein D
MIDGVSVILRALGFIAIFQAAGMAIFMATFQAMLTPATASGLRRTGLAAAVAALLLVAIHFTMEPARLGGDLAAIANAGLRDIVLHSSLAEAFAWRACGLLLLIIGFALPARSGQLISLLGALLLLIAFTRTGHATTHSPRFLLAALLLSHIATVAFWFGSLLPLRRVATREPPTAAARIVETFSRLALWLVPLLAVAGIALAILLLQDWSNLATPYGRLVLLKVVLFSVLMMLAALNRRRYGPALASGVPRAATAFSRVVLAEFILIAAVLGTTAALTTFHSPES